LFPVDFPSSLSVSQMRVMRLANTLAVDESILLCYSQPNVKKTSSQQNIRLQTHSNHTATLKHRWQPLKLSAYDHQNSQTFTKIYPTTGDHQNPKT